MGKQKNKNQGKKDKTNNDVITIALTLDESSEFDFFTLQVTIADKCKFYTL